MDAPGRVASILNGQEASIKRRPAAHADAIVDRIVGKACQLVFGGGFEAAEEAYALRMLNCEI
jgi:hypothetical protein